MQRRHKILLAIGLFSAAVIAHQPLRRVALRLFRFPLVVVQGGVAILVQSPRLPAMLHENQQLHRELTAQQLEVTMLREALRHERRTQELLAGWPGSRLVIASLVGLPVIPTQHVVLLDKGSADGVAADSILLAAGGLVGRIIESHASTSVALLLTDPDSRVACLIERSRESGLLVGTGESLCRLLYLDVDADVQLNDRVVTAGLGRPFPKGLMVGTVVRVERDEPNARSLVWVKPSVRLSQIEEVACLPPQP
ncbi:MAG: rod shape-determining protein MreC [Candidatus Omnitrophica bacterium]|nr:rod shape-determining protein MreC [Candidatus Omnitrophota bacterium]